MVYVVAMQLVSKTSNNSSIGNKEFKVKREYLLINKEFKVNINNPTHNKA